MKKNFLIAFGIATLVGTLSLGISVETFASSATASTQATDVSTSGSTTVKKTIKWESHVESEGDGTLFYSATLPTRQYIINQQAGIGQGWAQEYYYSTGKNRKADGGQAIWTSTWNKGDIDKGFVRETHTSAATRPRSWSTVGWIISAAQFEKKGSQTLVNEKNPGNLNWEIRLINDPTGTTLHNVERHDYTTSGYATWRGVTIDPATGIIYDSTLDDNQSAYKWADKSKLYESIEYAEKIGIPSSVYKNCTADAGTYKQNVPSDIANVSLDNRDARLKAIDAHRYLVSYNIQSDNINNVTFYYMSDIYDQIKLECPEWWDYIEEQNEKFVNGEDDCYIAFKLDAMQCYIDGDRDKWSGYLNEKGYVEQTRWDGSTAFGDIRYENTAVAAATGNRIPIVSNSVTGIDYVEAYNVTTAGMMTKYSIGSLGTENWSRASSAWQNTSMSKAYSYGSKFTAGNSVRGYYNIGVEFLARSTVEIETVTDPDPIGDRLDDLNKTTIGRTSIYGGANGAPALSETPFFKVYNYATDGKYDIGEAIPTSEDVTAGFIADEWSGFATIYQRQIKIKYGFRGSITYEVPDTNRYTVTVTDENTGETTTFETEEATTRTVTEQVTSDDIGLNVERNMQYFIIGNVYAYDLESVTMENDVYPGGEHGFTSPDKVTIKATQHGVDLTVPGAQESNRITSANDKYHVQNIQWSSTDYDALINCSGSTRDEAVANFKAIAESRITPEDEIQIRNDSLSVTTSDGVEHVLVDDTWHNNGASKNSTLSSGQPYAFNAMYQTAEYYNGTVDTPTLNDFGVEKQTESGTIPSDTKNKKYYTAATAKYTNIMGTRAATDAMRVTYTKSDAEEKKIYNSNSPASSYFPSGLNYRTQEPIYIHTPVISPVEITYPGTAEKLDTEHIKSGFEYMVPQLVRNSSDPDHDAYNDDADYQLLLDNTYTITFRPKEHAEHVGYADSASNADYSLYNKYTKHKYVAFPFTVRINDKIYEPSATTSSPTDDKPGKLYNYTEWIELYSGDYSGGHDFQTDFYIPTWAIENDADTSYKIMYMVVPENADANDFLTSREQYEANTDYDPSHIHVADYMATYSMEVQLSGWIYDFQITGINDKDRFYGYDNGKSWGYGAAQFWAFCPDKEEKKIGRNNRLGFQDYIRYTYDGTLVAASNWKSSNLLPLHTGSSNKYPTDGELIKGNTFGFTLRTIANLYDEEIDEIHITPTFRWISKDGSTTYENVKVYYDDDSNQMIARGSVQDLASVWEASISDEVFKGAYYGEDKSLTTRTLWQFYNLVNEKKDDLYFSTWQANQMLYQLHHPTTPSYPTAVYNENSYLNKKVKSYNLNSITLTSELRFLTGNREQLAMNLNKEGSALQYVSTTDDSGALMDITPDTDPTTWVNFRKSMQEWFGEYMVPSTLYVTRNDAPDVQTYIEEKGYLDLGEENTYVDGSGNEQPLFLDGGYLVVNFQITTINDGKEHLQYYGTNDGTKDQWSQEGKVSTTTVGDPTIGEDITIPVRSGDTAIVDLERSIQDRYYIGTYIKQ